MIKKITTTFLTSGKDQIFFKEKVFNAPTPEWITGIERSSQGLAVTIHKLNSRATKPLNELNLNQLESTLKGLTQDEEELYPLGRGY